MALFKKDGTLSTATVDRLTPETLAEEVSAVENAYARALEAKRAGRRPSNFQQLAEELYAVRTYLRQCGEAAGTRHIVSITEES